MSAVRDIGQMRENGWQPENVGYLAELTTRRSGRTLQGVNPLEIPLEILTRAGHPRRRSAIAVLSACRGMEVLIARAGHPRRFTELINVCRECVATEHERRLCACIECPIWPYRMGKNPHHPRRGKAPEEALAAIRAGAA